MVGGQRHAQNALPPLRRLQEAGWTPRPVRTGAENLACAGIRCPDRQSRSESIYRAIPAHKSREGIRLKEIEA